MAQVRILIMHLVSNGDCLYATAIARQIKKDNPGCHLTWLISKKCSSVLINNPHVDELVEVEVGSIWDAGAEGWHRIKAEMVQSGFFKTFNQIYFTQFFPENIHHFDGTIRSTLFRSYTGGKVDEVTPELRLTRQEETNAEAFANRHGLSGFNKVVLFECSPGSSQSFVNPEIALGIAHKMVSEYPDMMVVLSSHLSFETNHPRILLANTISFRENARLANYCDLLIGCSSGITWLCTSSAVRRDLPMIQLLSKSKGISFASVAYDLQHWGLEGNRVVEIFENDQTLILSAVRTFFTEGIKSCKLKFHEAIKPNPFHLTTYFNMLAKRGRIVNALGLFNNFIDRNGWSFQLVMAIPYILLQGLFRVPLVLFRKMAGSPVQL